MTPAAHAIPDSSHTGSGGSRWPVRLLATVLVLMLCGDGWLLYKRHAYAAEITRLRANMTQFERNKADVIVANEQDKVGVELALARLQMNLDPRLHLAVSADSGRMYLEREGAILREMPVQLGRDVIAAAQADSVADAAPLGDRTIAEIRSGEAPVLILEGGTRIVGMSAKNSAYPSAPGSGSTIAPGEIRARTSDLTAILPDLYPGMKVYFY